MRPGDHSDMTYQEIEEDNPSSLFIKYCHWLGINSVPRNARVVNGELLPPVSQEKDAPVTIVMVSTLVKYVGRIIAWLRRIYPRHPDFVSLKVGDPNAVPEWWTHLSPQLKKQCHRREENLTPSAEAVFDSSPSDGDDGAPAPIVAVQQPLNLAPMINPPAPPKPLFAPTAQENSSGKGNDISSVLLQLSKQGYLKQGA